VKHLTSSYFRLCLNCPTRRPMSGYLQFHSYLVYRNREGKRKSVTKEVSHPPTGSIAFVDFCPVWILR
jgi:hypothetical protein